MYVTCKYVRVTSHMHTGTHIHRTVVSHECRHPTTQESHVTRVHTCAHTLSPSLAGTHKTANIHTHTHMHLLGVIVRHLYVCGESYVTLTHKHIRNHEHTTTLTHTHIYMHTRTLARSHVCMLARTHACMHARTYVRTRASPRCRCT